VMARIALFYIGSVVLLVLLMPWTAYKAGQSPFVTFFGAMGVPGIGTAMNIVVLTAALSSLNSGLYSTGRVLRSLAMGGSAPTFVSRMNKHKVPYGGILVTLVIYLFGVGLNYLVPSQVFEIVLNIASLGVISTWAIIVVCQMKLRAAQDRGEIARVEFRMPWSGVTSWLTLAFLVGVLVLMALDYPTGTYTLMALPAVMVMLCAGWITLKGTSPFAPTAPSYALTKLVDDNETSDPR
jgi:L-asparagine permease